ncbi:MAG TPA: hypothetical protein DCS82_06215 [Rhodospirillaceae bacterium]|nr:hypothetical protein [Rhodospirillaceae bacterium]HAT35291.1 hypothetical protein [Rhodospirillaceae bacterium]
MIPEDATELLRPVDGPVAWQAEDLRTDQSWIWRLNATDLAEIDSALESARQSGKSMPTLCSEDFPLPTMGPRLVAAARDLDTGRGCLLIKGLDVGRYNKDEITDIYWGMGRYLGTPVTQNAAGDLIGNIRNSGRTIGEKNVRGYTTKNRMLPHCDPMDVVGLLCISPAKTGGRSLIASAIAIYNEICRTQPEYLPTLFRGFHYDLRGEGPAGSPDEVTNNRVPVFSRWQGRLSCRFHGRSIREGMKKAGHPLKGIDADAVDYVEALAVDDRFRFDMDLEQGDIQILNNYAVLHARDEFEDWPEEDRRRHLLRLWLNLDPTIARPLDPIFAARHNTGPRGAIHAQSEHSGWVPR